MLLVLRDPPEGGGEQSISQTREVVDLGGGGAYREPDSNFTSDIFLGRQIRVSGPFGTGHGSKAIAGVMRCRQNKAD